MEGITYTLLTRFPYFQQVYIIEKKVDPLFIIATGIILKIKSTIFNSNPI